MNSKRKLLLNAIEGMFNGNIDERVAICENLDALTEKFLLGYKIINKLSPSWIHFSGDKTYPISGDIEWVKQFEGNSLWKGEQRELRFSLLEHLKSELLKLTDEDVEELLS